MVSHRLVVRFGAVASTLALALGVAGCSGAAGPVVSACPAAFVETANAATVEKGIDVRFSPAVVADFRPAELAAFVADACILAFDGSIRSARATGTFAFLTGTLDVAAFDDAVAALGYQSVEGSWVKPISSTEADVITQTTPNGNGSLLDLSQIFPEATTVISSFRAKN